MAGTVAREAGSKRRQSERNTPASQPEQPHDLELDVQRRLLAEPSLKFSSLVVRRIRNGVCLEGVIETDEDEADVSQVVRKVLGMDQVLNHLVVCQRPAEPVRG